MSPKTASGENFSAADQAKLSDQFKGTSKKPSSHKKKPKSYSKASDATDGYISDGSNLNLQKSPQKSNSPMDGYIKQ
jgi:hypothetical protein